MKGMQFLRDHRSRFFFLFRTHFVECMQTNRKGNIKSLEALRKPHSQQFPQSVIQACHLTFHQKKKKTKKKKRITTKTQRKQNITKANKIKYFAKKPNKK